MARLEYRQGRQGAACQRLAQALLTASDHVLQAPSVIGATRLEYMAWTVLRYTETSLPNILEPAIVAAPWSVEAPENQWLWLNKLGDQALRPWPVADESWQVRPDNTPEERLVSVRIAQRSVREVLQRLAQEAGTQVAFSAAAQGLLAERQLHDVHVEGWPLGELLTLFADTADCAWYREGNSWYVVSSAELGAATALGERQTWLEQVRQSVNRTARATLNRLLLQSHDAAVPGLHRLFWLRGLSHQRLRERHDAAMWWERLLLRWPQQPESFYASFNLAVMHWEEGDVETAKRYWIRAADQAPDHRLTPLAYLYAGRTELEQLRVEQAVPLLRRAAHIAKAADVRPAALLLLSASYLHLDNAVAAHHLLVENRRVLQREPVRNCAAFLDALARSRLRLGRMADRREAEDLLTALLHVPDWRFLEPLGPLLAGQAWMRLHLPEQALRIYRQALPRARSEWRKELLLAYGESCLALGLHEEIQRTMRELLQSADVERTAAGHWLLARSALHQADYQKAIEHARQVLLQPAKVPRESVLRLLGEAYAAIGDAPRAAECFAGRFPEP
ncbi:hypothetical protein HRbin36_00975 [bacterium HR36]|nr:hypothetical protein HRbin36_00975 [bacterium HR36]